MPNLNSTQKEYLDSIHSYSKQFREAWHKTKAINFPFEFSNITDVIIAGMGGSAFGGFVLKTVFTDERVLIPVEVVNKYDLPGYADEKTLVIATSYSGNTEESLSVLKQAKERGCKVAIISSGGKLGNIMLSENFPGYIFEPKYNPSKAPRTSIGYVLGATLGVLSNLKLLDYQDAEANETAAFIDSFVKIFSKDDKLITQLAQKLEGFTPIFISAEHLTSAAHIWRNFFNETAKNMAFAIEIPEMNHHFLDSLLFPQEMNKKVAFVFIKSNFYNERDKKRIAISREVVKKSGFNDLAIALSANTKLNQVWELIIIGSLVSFQMAKIHAVNPSSNEFVDYLKSSLGK